MPKDESMVILKTLPLEDGELCNPKTHHAPVGAYVAKKEFGVDDEEVVSAIRWHTLGKVDMTTFEKIILQSVGNTRVEKIINTAKPIIKMIFL